MFLTKEPTLFRRKQVTQFEIVSQQAKSYRMKFKLSKPARKDLRDLRNFATLT
jgi:hypothetical protein